MDKIILGANPDGQQVFIEPKMANRHGLIAGATGTGKTVTLQILAEQFCKMGVPVFTADVKGGLGSASLQIQFPDQADGNLPVATVGALAVVNPVGSVTVPGEPNFWAAVAEFGDEFGGLGVAAKADALTTGLPNPKPVARQNTTLVVVATDEPMNSPQLHRLAVSANTGLARAIYPANTPFDGDMVFSISTNAVRTDQDPLAAARRELVIGHAAALCVARAIARGVYLAESVPGDKLPTWRQRWN